ncbi:MAG: translation initiation factor [Bacteroidia bacterium]|nr:translation initiation factor [Bacteroidia bacterium]HQU99943.1 translation initiation factor [Bacteroidia bacterium]
MSNKNKLLNGVVYSTNKSYQYETNEANPVETLPPNKQILKIRLETKHRGGKEATVISNFVGLDNDAEKLAKILKTKCGVGGSYKDGEIIIQGDMRNRIKLLLIEMGYQTKG